MTLGVAGVSVFARFGDEERRSMRSAFRLFDARGPKATLFVPVAGVRVECCPRVIELTFLMSCLALTTKAGTEGVLSVSRYIWVTPFRSLMRSAFQWSG